MRYITVPEDIVVRPPPDVLGGDPNAKLESVSFRKWAFTVWLDDARAIDGGFTRQVRWAKVVDAFRPCVARDVLPFEDDDYATLRTIVESPQRFAPATVTVQMLPFSRAILDAPEKDPRVAANGEAHAS